MTIDEKTDIFKSSILQSEWLIDFDYTLKDEARDAFPSGAAYYWMEFTNQQNRCVKAMLHFSENDVIVVGIENTSDDDGIEEAYFSLMDWMTAKALHQNGFFNLSNYPGDFQEKLTGFFEALETVFNHPDLKPILTGDTWEEIPFDWGDMK